MLFISTLHIGTDVYIVEFKFSSEQKMLVESLGPALTQEGRMFTEPGREAKHPVPYHSIQKCHGEEARAFSLPVALLFFRSALLWPLLSCVVTCCAVWCVLTDQPQPGVPLPGLQPDLPAHHSAAGSSRTPRANREPISGNLEQRLCALLSHGTRQLLAADETLAFLWFIQALQNVLKQKPL